MNLSKIILDCLLIATLAACTVNIRAERFVPKYASVDPEMTSLVNKYLELAKNKNLLFKHNVTVGFTNIKENDVIGECHYESYFREIDIDRSYWDRSTTTSRMTLLWHELTHGYCDRGHDYKEGKHYDSINSADFSMHKDFEVSPKFNHSNEGGFQDGCPLSIMFPKILSDSCMRSHYAEYVDEMFNRCKEY